MKRLFEGTCVALVTPFKNQKVDYYSLDKLIDYQLSAKIDAISILGTTGEPCTLSDYEKKKIIRHCAKLINGKTKLIVGSGGNNTKKVIKDSVFARDNGADGLLIVTPYYNKCTQDGLVKFYDTIAEKVKAPFIVYNVPTRTGLNILPATLEKIGQNEFVYGFKQANPSIAENLEIFEKLREKIAIYSGDDQINYIFYCLGGSGSISVTANAYPEKVKTVYENVRAGEYKKALLLQEELSNINKLLFSEVNPIPIKACLAKLNLCADEVRPPLTVMRDRAALHNEMKKLSQSLD